MSKDEYLDEYKNEQMDRRIDVSKDEQDKYKNKQMYRHIDMSKDKLDEYKK